MTASEILSRAADLLEARPTTPTRREFWTALVDASDAEGAADENYQSAVALCIERTGTKLIGLWARAHTLPQVLAMLRGNDWRNA